MRLTKYSRNFYHLILGRSARNIADSIYFIALSIGLVTVYHIQAGELSLFTLIGLLPNLSAFLYGGFLNRIRLVKVWLLVFQVLQLLLIILTIQCLRHQLPVTVMFLLNFLFSLSTNFLNTLQMRIIPATLDNSEELIHKSVDIQYLTSNVLDIASNFITSLLLAVLSYYTLLNMSLPFFVFAIYFIAKLRLLQYDRSDSDVETSPRFSATVTETLRTFKRSTSASCIVIMESFLSGGTDLLITLIPLYLISEGISIKYLGLVLATQRLADLIGAWLAPYVNIPYQRFFCLDYILTGFLFTAIFIISSPLIKLVLFAVGFAIIGISGNIFEKMIYAEYDYKDMGLIYSTNSSLYALFGILFLVIPQFYSNIKILGLIINSLTCCFGLGLWVFAKKTKQSLE